MSLVRIMRGLGTELLWLLLLSIPADQERRHKERAYPLVTPDFSVLRQVVQYLLNFCEKTCVFR